MCPRSDAPLGFPLYRYRCHPTTPSYRGTRKLWLLTPNPPPLSATRSQEKFFTASRREKAGGDGPRGTAAHTAGSPKAQGGWAARGKGCGHITHLLLLTGISVLGSVNSPRAQEPGRPWDRSWGQGSPRLRDFTSRVCRAPGPGGRGCAHTPPSPSESRA